MSNNISNSSRLSVNAPRDTSAYNFILVSIFLSILFLMIIYIFFSKQFRVYRITNNMNIYIKYQNLESVRVKEIKNYRLADFYICSSYNSAVSGYQMFDYVSPEMVKKVIQCGCRYLEFQVFGNIFGSDAVPIVSTGYKTGEWKLSLNTVNLEDIFKIIRDNAFTVFDGIDGSPNNLDPLIISLDLKTNFNYLVNNKIQQLFSKYFFDYLLDPSYNYQSKNIAQVPLKDLLGKVIIFSSDGFQGSTLEEIINYSWNYAKLKKLHYKEIEQQLDTNSVDKTTSNNSSNIEDKKAIIEHNELKKFNMNGLTIVSPHKEGDFLTANFNPNNAWSLGCQFVGMNFQKIDKNMDIYVNKFNKRAFILKPKDLRP
jgi:hypothetical protein